MKEIFEKRENNGVTRDSSKLNLIVCNLGLLVHFKYDIYDI